MSLRRIFIDSSCFVLLTSPVFGFLLYLVPGSLFLYGTHPDQPQLNSPKRTKDKKPRTVNYVSVRNASIGSSLAAFHAGNSPESVPAVPDASNANRIASRDR